MVKFVSFSGILLFNMGLMAGLIIGALLLLRPLLTQLLTPGQRMALWMVAWLPIYMPQTYEGSNMLSFLPVTFRSLVVPRVGISNIPTFFPEAVWESRDYHLALPGGALVRVGLNQWAVAILSVVVIGGILVCVWVSFRRQRELVAQGRTGRLLEGRDPLLQNVPGLDDYDVVVRLCRGLPASFVVRGKEIGGLPGDYSIFLQEGMPPEQIRLVLRHEAQHIKSHHVWCKGYANIGLALYWWNPLVWLGYRAFCRDLELACDRAVLRRLAPEERREYAKTLVELGSGRQLWEAPLAFGECDAQLRVREAVEYRPGGWKDTARTLAAGVFTLALILFFLGGPSELDRFEDALLAKEQSGEERSDYVHRLAEQAGVWEVEDASVLQAWYWTERREWVLVRIGSPIGHHMAVQMENGRWWTIELYGGGCDNFYGRNGRPLDQSPVLSGCARVI